MDKLGDVISRQDWLKPAEKMLTLLAKATLERQSAFAQKVRNFLHGTWLGHPLHPVITDVPLGAWSLATVFDIYEASTGEEALAAGADTAVKIGLIGAGCAAEAGFTDWHYTYEKPRRVGVLHAVVNLAATACYLTSWWQRRQGDRRTGLTTGFVGYALSIFGAYLGGHLVFNERIGVNHAPEELPTKFKVAMPEKDLPEGKLHKAEVDGIPVLLVRKEGRIFALVKKCSHLGGPLSKGRFDGETVECPWHYSKFAIEGGSVVAGPAAYRQPCFEVRVRAGNIEVRAPRGMVANPY
jgi:nitrite reductase/ring-hydroxylating ferredoxin subunit